LPYDEDALAPDISARTLRFHHGKHHKAYIDKTNALVANTAFAALSLEDVVRKTVDDPAQKALFNNAAQAWNHAFYWNSISPTPGTPSEALAAAIARDFGSTDALAAALAKKGTEHFGSGWAWLVVQGNTLAVVDTHDGDTPMAHGIPCLLALDVWEHAYYLDHQNDRKTYAESVTKRLLNWTFASANFARAS
jgi:Fe-Mn family superoxide dismutase